MNILSTLKTNLKKPLINSIEFYQKFISPMLGSNCRYYPSCSEYAKIEFDQDTLPRAFAKSALRILRCNQLFKGGIEYPVIKKEIKPNILIKKTNIKYWLIPTKKKHHYIIIKAENGK